MRRSTAPWGSAPAGRLRIEQYIFEPGTPIFTVPEAYYWFQLANLEALADLTAEDRAAWDAWVDTPQVGAFLDQVIAKCKAQSEPNKKSSGYMAFHSPPSRMEGMRQLRRSRHISAIMIGMVRQSPPLQTCNAPFLDSLPTL